MLYALARLALGAVRLDPTFLFGLQIEQILALGVLIFGVWFGLRPVLSARARRTAPVAATGQAQVTKDSVAA